MGTAVIEHRSPTRGRRWHAESEKAHGGFGENRSRHADRGLHDYGLNNVGKNVADDDAHIAGSEGAGGFHELSFARGENLTAHEPRVSHPASERQREHQI